MNALSLEQVAQFRRDGYIVARDVVTAPQLERMRRQLDAWIEESRLRTGPFGPPCMDGKPRIDMGSEHTPERPAVRRVNSPAEISDIFLEVVSRSPMVEMVAELIGPDVKFHHCKVNVKLPGSRTVVDYHQDFSYTPHTNDDLVTALIMLDDMTGENGCLMAVRGSHRGPLHSLYQGDRFTGKVDAETERTARSSAVPVYGRAGDACLMHTRLLHGSAANRSAGSRALYICVYSAADAFPLAANPLPSAQAGMIVKGRPSRRARLMDVAGVELPPQWSNASFFDVQGQKSAGA